WRCSCTEHYGPGGAAASAWKWRSGIHPRVEAVVKLGSGLSAGEDGHVFHADGVDERVGMAVHQPPLRSFAPEDQGHAQRPVLVRQATYLAVLPLDHHEYRQVTRRVGLDELQLRLAAPEHFRRGFQCRLDVEATRRFSAVRRHERVVVAVLDQREVPANVSSYIRGGSLRGA